ncbi:hypothetical protein [Brachybacterium sp.]|uniref:hypothetical protein n=1 Tax=Brachybacterium sp. TaxID=1891286 RepID=UPI002ED51534
MIRPGDSRPSRLLDAEDTTAAASGPLLAVCAGHRCAALRRLAGTAGTVDELGAAVRAAPGAVLITTDCLGRCEVAALAGIARHHGPSGQSGRTVWLAGAEQTDRAEALRRWVVDGGPSRLDRPDVDLPPSLAPAAIGLGPGIRITPSQQSL